MAIHRACYLHSIWAIAEGKHGAVIVIAQLTTCLTDQLIGGGVADSHTE